MWKIEERRAKGMEDFPVQVIGTILSHIAAVNLVVRAGHVGSGERQRVITCKL
jgi:hypothetical protein